MKKRILTMILMAALSATVFAGCGDSTKPASSDNAVTDETGAGETNESTAPECEHDWIAATCAEPKTCALCGETEGDTLEHTWAEATFASPKKCSLCGETEGERRQSYFEEHSVDVPDAPVACTINGVICNPDHPEEYQMPVDTVWEQIDCYSEPDEEGYQLVHLELSISLQQYYDAVQDVSYHSQWIIPSVYDWYTGLKFPSRGADGDDVFDYGTTLKIDGVDYDVSYRRDVRWEYDDWVYDDSGDGTKNVRGYISYSFKVPDGYDGLVFAAIPKNEYTEVNTETVDESEEYAFDEDECVEGTAFFRINRDADSKIMTGSGNAADENLAGAVIDDSREQGSIGESGLPYYKLGFSPEDFTIGGMSVYDDKTVDEMFDAVDLPDFKDTNGSVDGWYKSLPNGKTVFGLSKSNESATMVHYINDEEVTEIDFYTYDDIGYTIAEADFVHSAVIPGESTFAEALKLLGIEDLFGAMGIKDNAFKSVEDFVFESQFSETTHSRVSWGDNNKVDVWWLDRDGKEVRLTLRGEGDVVNSLTISKQK